MAQTPTSLVSSSGGKGLDKWTSIFICFKGSEDVQLRVTWDKPSFLPLCGLRKACGIGARSQGYPLALPHSVAVCTQGHFSLRTNKGIGRKVPASEVVLHPPENRAQGSYILRRILAWTWPTSVGTLNLVSEKRAEATSDTKPSASILARLQSRQGFSTLLLWPAELKAPKQSILRQHEQTEWESVCTLREHSPWCLYPDIKIAECVSSMKKYSKRIACKWIENSRMECALYSWLVSLLAPQPKLNALHDDLVWTSRYIRSC